MSLIPPLCLFQENEMPSVKGAFQNWEMTLCERFWPLGFGERGGTSRCWEQTSVAWSKWPNLVKEEMEEWVPSYQNVFQYAYSQTLLEKEICLLCFDGSSCLSSGSLYIFHRTLSMMVHTCWCLEHTRTKFHLTKVWIPLWIHMALGSILILTQGLNWLRSSVALLELGWARTSCSRKLAHLCSLAVSECPSIQTPIWGLEGGLHPHCMPFGVDRVNDSVPDHPLGTICIIRDLHVSSSQS